MLSLKNSLSFLKFQVNIAALQKDAHSLSIKRRRYVSLCACTFMLPLLRSFSLCLLGSFSRSKTIRRSPGSFEICLRISVNLFSFILFCFVLFCFVLFCFVLFCFVLFCFVLFCLVYFDLFSFVVDLI